MTCDENETEVTEKMIKAGADELMASRLPAWTIDEWRQLAINVFRTMTSAKIQDRS